MSARLTLLPMALTIAVFIGCGQPQAEFVYNDQTNELARPASQTVKSVLEDSFGTPQQLVAWLKLPVEYGSIEGTVGEGAAAVSATEFQVEVSLSQDDAASVVRGSLGKLGVLWQSGPYQGAMIESGDEEGGQTPVEFLVTGYFPDEERDGIGVLGVRMSNAGGGSLVLEDTSSLREVEGNYLPPPAPGAKLAIVGKQLQFGRKLYMAHCMHCHGVSGDGAGPTAEYLMPRPRDYRAGIFKFTSTLPTEKIRRDDLERTIRHGIPGTYMPSFMLLEDDELQALVEYVRWLAMRGEMEQKLVVEMEAGGYSKPAIQQRVGDGESEEDIMQELADYIELDFPAAMDGAASILATSWENAEKETSVVLPKIAQSKADADSLERGRKLFLSDRAKCATCHGPRGRGNGSETETLKQIPGTNDYYPEPGLYDSWGNKINPRDLTRGIYRGGRRPVDLYRRIYSGIKGTPMPAFGGTVLKDEEIWDLVNYVMSLPYYGPDSPEQLRTQEVAASDSHQHE